MNAETYLQTYFGKEFENIKDTLFKNNDPSAILRAIQDQFKNQYPPINLKDIDVFDLRCDEKILQFAIRMYANDVYAIEIDLKLWIHTTIISDFKIIVEKVSCIKNATEIIKNNVLHFVLENPKIARRGDLVFCLFEKFHFFFKDQFNYDHPHYRKSGISEHYLEYLECHYKKDITDKKQYLNDIIYLRGLTSSFLTSELDSFGWTSDNDKKFEWIKYIDEKVTRYTKNFAYELCFAHKKYANYFLRHPLFFEKMDVIYCFHNNFLFSSLDEQIIKEVIQRCMKDQETIEKLFKKIEKRQCSYVKHYDRYNYLFTVFYEHGIEKLRIDHLKEKMLSRNE